MQAQIEDNGKGFPEVEMSTINRFFRSIKPVKSPYKNGYSLNIVKEITKQLKGDVLLESKVGFGSKFTVTFLLEPEPTFNFMKRKSKMNK